jgi:hypothetical protein
MPLSVPTRQNSARRRGSVALEKRWNDAMQRVLWSSAAISLDYGTLQLRHPAIANRMKLDTYPSIAKRAKQQGAEIYFWDESGFR